MKKFFLSHYKVIITTLVLVAMMMVPVVALHAATDLTGAINKNLVDTKIGDQLGGSSQTLPQTIGNIITVALSFLGVIFIIFILYAGFIWLTANGDDTKIKKAKGIIVNSIIAIIIIFLAFAITNFVLGTIIGNGIINSGQLQ